MRFMFVSIIKPMANKYSQTWGCGRVYRGLRVKASLWIRRSTLGELPLRLLLPQCAYTRFGHVPLLSQMKCTSFQNSGTTKPSCKPWTTCIVFDTALTLLRHITRPETFPLVTKIAISNHARNAQTSPILAICNKYEMIFLIHLFHMYFWVLE